MISTSRFVALCSLAAALGFHLVSVMAIDMDEEALMEAMEGANTAALGDGFEDLAIGTMEAQPVEAVAETPEVETAETPTTGVAAKLEDVPEADQPLPETAELIETNEAVRETEVAAAESSEAELAYTVSTEPAAQAQPTDDIVKPVEPTEAQTAEPLAESANANASSPVLRPSADPTVALAVTEAAKPDILEAVTPTPTAKAKPILKTAPVQMAALTPKITTTPTAKPAPTETIEAQEQQLEKGAVSRSKRPMLRTREVVLAQPEPKAKPKAKAKPKPKAQAKPKQKIARGQAPAPTKRGNAQQSARKGAATGNESAKASSQGVKKGTGKASGNARVSNYPGLVMRKIQRVRRPAVGSRGTAVIAFKVASNGGLSAVSVARSSGSSKLDQAAVKVVRKAAPFPKPPAGARRSFSIKIKGR